MGKVTRSDAVVACVLRDRPNARNGGLLAELRKRWDDEDLINSARRILPDAYEFHDDACVLALIEVVDTNPIRRTKAERIAMFGEVFEDVSEGWTVEVIVLDPCGNLIGGVPAWSFTSCYTSLYSHEKAIDMTPAARAVYRDASSGPEATEEQIMEALNSIGTTRIPA